MTVGAMDAAAGRTTRPRRAALAVPGVLLCVGLVLALWWTLAGTSRVVPVGAGASLLGVSRGTLTWLGRTCSVWQTQLEGAHAPEPLEPLLFMSECPPDNPRFDGQVVYHLSGLGNVTRVLPGRRRVLLERSLAFALALDDRFLYVGNCAQRPNCQIERLPAEDDPGDPLLMQAGILSLANMEVDQQELFWVDRGRKKPECHQEAAGAGESPGPLRCKDPVPPRLMAASKSEPRAIERVVLSDFDGRRPFLGARHVYWLGAGGVHRVPKAGGSNELLLPTRALSGFASDGDEVYLAADAGIFRVRDGGDARSFQSTRSPPRGVAVDADHVYWIDADDHAVMRRRR